MFRRSGPQLHDIPYSHRSDWKFYSFKGNLIGNQNYDNITELVKKFKCETEVVGGLTEQEDTIFNNEIIFIISGARGHDIQQWNRKVEQEDTIFNSEIIFK
jgi:hypothetical protein